MATPQITQTCHGVARHLPLCHVLNWSPFRIDALGLVTMIGAEEVNAKVGRLVPSRLTEYLPLLGAYIIANDGFTEAYPGFQFYNLTAGIFTSDMAGWFQRWCMSQEFSRSGSIVTWTLEEDWDPKEKREIQRADRWNNLLAVLIGVVANGGLLALTILQGDWWGLANAISMVLSVFVRSYTMHANRKGLDAAVRKSDETDDRGPPDNRPAKCFVITSNNTAITMIAPSKIVKTCFIDRPKPADETAYLGARAIGWIAFSGHVITLGMSGLATQMVTVFLIVVPTVMTVFKYGCNDGKWGGQEKVVGSKLRAEIKHPASERRLNQYIELNLSEKEETSMIDWNLFPHKLVNPNWWVDYNQKKEESYPQPSLANRNGPAGNAPNGNAPNGNAPNGNALNGAPKTPTVTTTQ